MGGVQQVEIYADESGSLNTANQAVSMISGSAYVLDILATELNQIKSSYQIDELKSTKIRTNQDYVDCAEDRLKVLLSYAFTGQIHIRGKASDQADQFSFDKRFLRGLHTLNSLYDQVIYSIVPDENPAIPRDRHGQRRSQVLPIKEIRQVQSDQEPITQACDLIAGLLRRCTIHFERYHTDRDNPDQHELTRPDLHKIQLLSLLEKGTNQQRSKWSSRNITIFV